MPWNPNTTPRVRMADKLWDNYERTRAQHGDNTPLTRQASSTYWAYAKRHRLVGVR